VVPLPIAKVTEASLNRARVLPRARHGDQDVLYPSARTYLAGKFLCLGDLEIALRQVQEAGFLEIVGRFLARVKYSDAFAR
jgi:hypothetical protein